MALLETTPYGRQLAVDERVIARAEKLRRFFGQPFFAAERYTKRPGPIVTRAESLRVCREILDGVHDDVPTDAFFSRAASTRSGQGERAAGLVVSAVPDDGTA